MNMNRLERERFSYGFTYLLPFLSSSSSESQKKRRIILYYIFYRLNDWCFPIVHSYCWTLNNKSSEKGKKKVHHHNISNLVDFFSLAENYHRYTLWDIFVYFVKVMGGGYKDRVTGLDIAEATWLMTQQALQREKRHERKMCCLIQPKVILLYFWLDFPTGKIMMMMSFLSCLYNR